MLSFLLTLVTIVAAAVVVRIQLERALLPKRQHGLLGS